MLQASGDARFDDMACMAGENQNVFRLALAVRCMRVILFPSIGLVIVLSLLRFVFRSLVEF